jgi:hypothetical protein
MSLWQKYEDLVLEFMESRVSELLDQGDVTSPKVIANVRETAAWAAERAVARFQARDVGENLRKNHINS